MNTQNRIPALRLRVLLVAAVFTIAYSAGIGLPARYALARESQPSVLIVDSNLGDLEPLCVEWLGSESKVIAEDDSRQLLTSDAPIWWGEVKNDDALKVPSTFVLGCKDMDKPITSNNIVWALDRIRESGAEPRTFVMAVGTTGLRLREYAENQSKTKQTSRADIVGLGFCGTPNYGYSQQAVYPELSLWNSLAKAAGYSVNNIIPDSDYLKNLNGGTFPAVTKSLVISGLAGDLGFGPTDGAAVMGDLMLGTSITSQVMQNQTTSTIGSNINLSSIWLPISSSINYPGRSVDKSLADRMSAIDCYQTTDELRGHVREFYESWYSNGAPVTHNSNVLAIDLSGSMLDTVEGGMSKLDAAKGAAKEYLHAMRACSELPQSAPMDVSVIGFSETLAQVANSYDEGASKAIDAMEVPPLYNETNIGIALDNAIATLKASPTCAKKHVLLLSDGAATRGLSNEAMLSGPVAEAKRAGITVDVVGFGDVGESNASFLHQVADATNGTYCEARNSFELKVNFLKAYYSSLGYEMVDEELPAQNTSTKVLGNVGERTSALMLGVVAEGSDPQVTVKCNGTSVNADQLKIANDSGLTSVQYVNPDHGDYEVGFSGHSGKLHVFAVKQLGISSGRAVHGQKQDPSLYLLIATGALMVVSVTTVVILTVRKRH